MKKFKFLLFFTLCLFTIIKLPAQTNKIDSLNKLLKNTSSQKEEINILLQLSWLERRTNPVESMDYSFKAYELSKKHNFTNGLLKSISYIGVAMRSAEYYSEAINYFNQALDIATEEKIDKEIGFAYTNLGYTYFLKKNYSLAKEYLLKAGYVAEKINDNQLKDYSYSYLINTLIEQKKYKDALKWSNKLYKVTHEVKNPVRMGLQFRTQGDIYSYLSDFENSLKNYQSASNYFSGDTLNLNITYHKIAILYLRQSNKTKSIEYAYKVYNNLKAYQSSGFLENDFSELLISVSEILSELYEQDKEFEKVAEFQKTILKEKDKIFNNSTSHNIIRSNMNMRLQEITNKNLKLDIENQKKSQNLERRRFFEVGGFLILAFLVLFSITLFYEKKKLKEANTLLIQQKEELKGLNVTKDKFFSIIAHDLKNPFHALLGFTEIMRYKIDNNNKEELITIVDYITETLDSSYKLLENLLNWSQSQKGTITYAPKKLNTLELFLNIEKLMKMNLEQKSIELKISCAEDIYLFADLDMLKTVFRNLISNAIKFSHKNSKIDIKIVPQNEFVKISIIDYGLGINEKNIPKLFEIAENISTHGTSGEKGTGIGLPLSKEFIEKNKGQIGVTSSKEIGSEFWVLVPSFESA